MKKKPHLETPEYFRTLGATLDELTTRDKDSFKYVMRLSASFTAIGIVVEPTFDFLGVGGAGTFIELPYKRMMLKRRKTVVRWRATATPANGYLDHELVFRTPAPALTVQTNFSVTLSTPINWNPDAAVTPTGLVIMYQSAEDSDFKETAPLLVDRSGFSVRVAPVLAMTNRTTPANVTIQNTDNVLVDMAFEFDVLPE